MYNWNFYLQQNSRRNKVPIIAHRHWNIVFRPSLFMFSSVLLMPRSTPKTFVDILIAPKCIKLHHFKFDFFRRAHKAPSPDPSLALYLTSPLKLRGFVTSAWVSPTLLGCFAFTLGLNLASPWILSYFALSSLASPTNRIYGLFPAA